MVPRYLSRFVVLPAQNILVGARIPEATVFAGRSRYLIALAGTALVLLLIGASLAYLIGRSLTRRIKLTQSALDSISSGEFGVRIEGVGGGDAISVDSTSYQRYGGCIRPPGIGTRSGHQMA